MMTAALTTEKMISLRTHKIKLMVLFQTPRRPQTR